MFEEGAEDFGLHLGPVVLGRLAEQDQFVVCQLQAGRFEEEAAVEVADAFEPSAGSGRVEVHGLE
jgi:hypothetical protein